MDYMVCINYFLILFIYSNIVEIMLSVFIFIFIVGNGEIVKYRYIFIYII